MLFYFSLGILILSLGAQIILRSFGIGSRFKSTNNNPNLQIYKKVYSDAPICKAFGYIFFFSIFVVFVLLSYDSYLQYSAWSQNEVTKLFLPPYQPINYFLFYVGMRFFGPYLISLVFAFLFFVVAKYLNKKYQERFFYEEEFFIGALAIFLIGYPLAIFYLIGVISIYLLSHFILAGASKNLGSRLSTYYLWLPIAISVIIIKTWLQILPWWGILKF